MPLEMCHLLLTLNFIRKGAQICDRCSLEYFTMFSRFHSRGRTHDDGSVRRIAFKAASDKLLMNKFIKRNFGGGRTLKSFRS